jgi:hypothetical protein
MPEKPSRNSEILRHLSPGGQDLAGKREEHATLEPEAASSLTVPFPTLQDAIATYTVTAEFRGNGGSSGDSVLAELAKGAQAGTEALSMSLPAGSVLLSDDASVQNMMIAGVRGILHGVSKYRPETRIVLTDSDPVVYVLAAYCMEFEKENPSHDTRFRLERPDPALERIAQLGASLKVPAMQSAVWMHTDGVTFDRMNQKLPITQEDWSAGEAVFLKCRSAAGATAAFEPTRSENEDAKVSVKPEEDARLLILEAEIERHWLQYRKAYVRELRKENRLEIAIKATALDCVKLLHQYQEKGHNPDQAREAMWAYLIHPRQD